MIVRGRHPRLRQAAVALAMLAPALVMFGTFVGYPAARALWISLYDWTGFSPQARWVGTEHYLRLFGGTAIAHMPLLVGLAAAACGGMAVGRAMARSPRSPVRRAGSMTDRVSGLALTAVLLGFLVVWVYGSQLAGPLRWVGAGGVAGWVERWHEGDSFFRSCVRNNFTYMLIGGVFHFIYAFLFAAALNLPALRGKLFYRTMIFFPSFISAVGVAMLWQRIYDTRSGLINFMLEFLRIGPFEWLSGQNMLNSIIACGVWAGVGSQMILLLAGMQRIPETYYEAARIDGAGEGQLFLHVTVPLLREVILIVVTLWVIGSLRVFGLFQAFAIGSEETWSVISVRQYELAFSNRDNIYMMGYATAMAVVLLVLVVVFAVGLRSLRQRETVEF